MLPAMRRLPALALLAALRLVLGGAAAAAPSLGDPGDAEAFVTGFLQAELAERRVPGAVFVMVRGGEVLFARGFGMADLARGVPVDPERTLFRVASVSKLFTGTAAMQLVESGALDLGADVNQYLRGFSVPPGFGEPVRVRHLLTHTAGFDDRLMGMAASSEAAQEPLRAHLARRLPARVMPPGRVFSYSNYGMALLGAVIEEVSGRPFEAYVSERVLAPLGMTRSSFAPGPELRADLATGYALHRGKPEPLPYDWLNVPPAGGLAATAADMSRFLRAQLGGGALEGARILRPETLAEMHKTQFSHDPALPGVGLAFMERRHGRHRTLEHAGDWGGFASLLVLLPEADAGFFYSQNTDDLVLRERLVKALLDRYFPVERALPAEAPAGSEERVARSVGWYRWNRCSRDQLTKLLAFPLRVDRAGPGALRLVVPGGFIDPLELRETLPWRFARADGDEVALLRAEGEKPAATLFLAAFGLPFAFDRLSRWQEPPLQLAVLAGGALLAASALVAWPVAAWRRARRRPRWAPREPLARMATALGYLACFAWLAQLVGLAALLLSLPEGSLLRETPRALPAILAFGVVGALATFPFAGSVLLAFARGWWSLRFRVHFALVALGAAGLLAVLHDWNLVGFHY
jgi:CubicO group peptidase (beta-lactamase class C family)